MKTSILNYFLIFSVISLSAISCSKDDVVTTPDTSTTPTPIGTTSNLDNFFNQNFINATQYFTINVNSMQQITGAEGTQLFFQSNPFEDQGNAVFGNVDIELVEILTQADMIWLNKTTTSSGNLLISGGEISLKAFQNGNQLTLGVGGMISVSMPTNNPSDSMVLFGGTLNNNGDVDWALGINNSVINDSINNALGFNLVYGQFLNNDSLGLLNCDYFFGLPNLTSLQIIPPNGCDASNTAIYIFFHNVYSITHLPYYFTNPASFNSYPSTLPIGTQITIVAISEINGQYYSSFTPSTITANHSETIILSPTTEALIKTDLDNL